MENTITVRKELTTTSDIFGALASGLCLVHCFATPFFFLFQASAVTQSAITGSLWWGLLDYFFLGISLVAIYFSAANTPVKWMPAALYGSWGILTLFILNEKFHLFHLSHALMFIPAIGLVSLHLYNRRHCRCVDEECCVSD